MLYSGRVVIRPAATVTALAQSRARWRALVRSLGRALPRSRAVQFVVLGAIIFAVAPRPDDPSKVPLSTSDLETLHAAQAARVGARALAPAQVAEVDERAIEDEVLYR